MSDCIAWTGRKTKAGYGLRWFRGATTTAHRAAWIEEHGAIPDGLEVCHSCDQRDCVNLDHLWLGTHRLPGIEETPIGQETLFKDLEPVTGSGLLTSRFVVPVLVTPVGTVMLRAPKQFMSGRKLGRTHQSVLVFWKGEKPPAWKGIHEQEA